MGEFFGELERLAADLYPYRWYVIAAVVVGLAAIGVYGYRGGWHHWLWRHRIPVVAVGTPLVVVAAFLAYSLGSPLFTNVTVDEELPFALAIPDNTDGNGDAPPTPRGRRHDGGRSPVYSPRHLHRRPWARRRSRQWLLQRPRHLRAPLQRRPLPLLYLTPGRCRRRRGRPRLCLSLPPRPCPRQLRDPPLRQRPRPSPVRARRRLPRRSRRRLRPQPLRHPVTRRLSHRPRRQCPRPSPRPAPPRLPRRRLRRPRSRPLPQSPRPPLHRLPAPRRLRRPRRPLELP